MLVATVANSITAERGQFVLWGWRSLWNYHTSQEPKEVWPARGMAAHSAAPNEVMVEEGIPRG